MQEYQNVMQAIAVTGSDAGFRSCVTSGFQPTDAPAGSREKIEVLRQRAERGWPLWHELDRTDLPERLPAGGRHYDRP